MLACFAALAGEIGAYALSAQRSAVPLLCIALIGGDCSVALKAASMTAKSVSFGANTNFGSAVPDLREPDS